MRRARNLYFFLCAAPGKAGKCPPSVSPEAPFFSSTKETVYTCVWHLKRGSRFWQRFLLMGRDIQDKNVNFPDWAAGKEQSASACTLRVVSMEAVSRLEWRGSTRTLRVVAMVVVARRARCVRSRRCSCRFATVIILTPHPKYYLFAWPPHHAPQAI